MEKRNDRKVIQGLVRLTIASTVACLAFSHAPEILLAEAAGAGASGTGTQRMDEGPAAERKSFRVGQSGRRDF